VSEDQIVRPNPLQWLRYVYTGRLPRRHAAWVLYDATCSTWLVRHAIRYLVLVAPVVVALLVFVPMSLSVRIEGAFAAAASVLIGYMCFVTESLESRVEKAGYPYGLAGRMREERSIAAQRAVAARSRSRRGER
jgi:uncharacterized protein DUF5313